MNITFENPEYLLLLLIIPFLILLYFYGFKLVRKKYIQFANVEALERVAGKMPVIPKNYITLALRIAALASFILVLTGPIIWHYSSETDSDFVIAIDSSGSMLADDFKPNRLEAAKQIALHFINALPSTSEVGIISFSGVSFVKQKLTADRLKITRAVEEIRILSASGTALGDVIVNSANLFANEQKSRALMLFTDGQNTVGTSLEDAIAYANEKMVTIYPIGIATVEGGRFEALEAVSKIDEESLNNLADRTNGYYLKATANLEEFKQKIVDIVSSSEKQVPLKMSMPLLLIGLAMLLIEWGLVNTIYKRIPV